MNEPETATGESSPVIMAEPLTRRRPVGYASETAGLLSANRNMFVAIVALCLMLGCSLYVNFLDRKTWRNARVNFVGVNPDGSLVTLDADMFDFPVSEKTLRFALIDFVRKHYERVRGQVTDNWGSSLQFLEDPVRKREMSTDGPGVKAVEEGRAEEVRLETLNVALRNTKTGCEKSECQASVVVKKTLYRGSVNKEIRSTIELSFELKPREVTDRKVRAGNPMGLLITDLHEYQYFEPDEPTKVSETAVRQ